MSYTDLGFHTAQPYPAWEDARRECPVVARKDSFSAQTTYDITRYADAERVLRDWETFSSDVNGEVIGEYMGELILAMGGREHRAYRNLVAHAFRPSAIARWDTELVEPIIHRVLDPIAPLGRAELVSTVTSQYPVQVICGIVGVPLSDHEQFHRWSEEINMGPLDPPRGHAASAAMRAYLQPIVEDRRAHPNGDLVSELVHAEVDGERLSDEKIYGFLRLLLPAGAETTFRVLGSALVALLTHPDDLARVVADRDLLPAVVEETLRWETSVTMVMRRAAVDTEVAGCPIPAGAGVSVLTGSSDRDADRFDEPDEWRLDRPVQHHLAFGTGPHQCLGMHLARLELRVALDAILMRLPNLRLDPDFPPPEIEGYAFRGPESVHVLFDPS